jgi:hypothetical protein
MLRRLASLPAIFLLANSPLGAQQEHDPLPPDSAVSASTTPGKQATAARAGNGAVRVDGALDEEPWTLATPISDFVQKEPSEGAPPGERMEVRFLYDDEALYIGARMYSRDPSAIQAPLGRRDAVGDEAEHIFVSLDTFLDRRTAYTFGVSASGVRLDRFHATDNEGGDAGFNPVWEARTRVDGEGWTAELWIPFTQLRFSDRPEQVWGLNVYRFIPTLEEADYWVLIPRTERAWASRFGNLRGIEGVRPTRRLELLPFVLGSTTMTGESRDPQDPFDDGHNLTSRAGLDMKVGLGPNLTLDATVNPDFGQVEADPAEVNLTAFATRFEERRPFFTEGAELLSPRHQNVFYSRRIGTQPVGRAPGDYVDYPSTSQILGAAKLTGRLNSGTSLGILAAVTDQEFAQTADMDSPDITRVRVAPRAAHAMVRVQQNVGNGGSTASVFLNAMHRDVGEGDPLASLLTRNAFAFGTDALLRFRGGQYEWGWAVAGSYVEGEPAAIARIQLGSSHYMQRPDLTYNKFDPTRESLAGLSMLTSFDRTGGRHWLFGFSTKVDFPTFETNDIGRLTRADGIQPQVNLTYRETQPGTVFRSYSLRLNTAREWAFGGEIQAASAQASVNLTWLNFWTTSFSAAREFRTENAGLTRGGPLMGSPHGWRANFNVGNRSSAQTRLSGGLSASGNELGGKSRQVNLNFSFRPGPRWQLSARPSFDRSTDPQQYVSTLSGGRPETYGSRYVFAYIERATYSMELRLGFTLKPDLNLDVYAEPFAASGRYYQYGELLAPGSIERLVYGTSGTGLEVRPDGSQVVTAGSSTFALANRDFNVRSFNSNVVLRWDWKPGSTMYLVWQQNRDERETVGTRIGVGDVLSSFKAPGSNILMFKTSWWLPVT